VFWCSSTSEEDQLIWQRIRQASPSWLKGNWYADPVSLPRKRSETRGVRAKKLLPKFCPEDSGPGVVGNPVTPTS
jgi:hypothetical protein